MSLFEPMSVETICSKIYKLAEDWREGSTKSCSVTVETREVYSFPDQALRVVASRVADMVYLE